MTPQSYRVLQPIHLGGTDPHVTLAKSEVVTFDGVALTREGGEKINLAQPGGFRGAIKVGWVVPVDSDQQTFVPKPAGVQVKSATSTGEARSDIKMGRVSEEERDIGHISAVRPDNAPDTHVARDAATVAARQEPPKPRHSVIRREGSDEGVVVGRMKLSSKSGRVQVGKDDTAIRQRLENGDRVGVEPVNKPVTRVATGDAEVTMTGDNLEELLPEAASSGRPKAGVYKDQPRAQRMPPADPEAALRHWAATGESWDDYPVSARDLQPLAHAVLRKLDAVRAAAEAAARQAPVTEDEVDEIEALIAGQAEAEGSPGFQWDLSAHWKTRQSRLQEYKTDAAALRTIRAMDTSGGVRKRIDEYLAAL